MPDSIRIEFEKIVSESRDSRENIYDESWRIMDRKEYFSPHDDENLNRQFPNTEAPIEMVDSTSRFILLVFVVFLILASLAAAWVLLF